jgi:molybdopterin-guanine dinucleotide biosynthesis protein A
MGTTPVAVLLAAGTGTRLGRDKPTVRLNGESLIQRHIRQARAGGAKSFVVVANEYNIAAITAHTTPDLPVQVILQAGPGAYSAALTGLRHLPPDCERVFLSGIVDIVPDDTYQRLAAALDARHGIALAAARLRRTFIGGMLVSHPDGQLAGIVERPPGGCRPGQLANIWIHHLAGRDLIGHLTDRIAALADYEDAVNATLANGAHGIVVEVTAWEAIKDAESLTRAQRMLDPRVTSPGQYTS